MSACNGGSTNESLDASPKEGNPATEFLFLSRCRVPQHARKYAAEIAQLRGCGNGCATTADARRLQDKPTSSQNNWCDNARRGRRHQIASATAQEQAREPRLKPGLALHDRERPTHTSSKKGSVVQTTFAPEPLHMPGGVRAGVNAVDICERRDLSIGERCQGRGEGRQSHVSNRGYVPPGSRTPTTPNNISAAS